MKHLFLFFILFFNLNLSAGYVVVKKVNNSFDIIDLKNTNKKVLKLLYEILLKHSWPTCGEHEDREDKETESEHLTRILSDNDLPEYEYIWIPDTIQDLQCASILLNNSLPVDNYKYTLESIHTLVNSNTYVENLKIFNENTMVNYFEKINLGSIGAFFICNNNIANFMLTETKNASTTIDKLFNDKKIRKSIRHKSVNTFAQEIFKSKQKNNFINVMEDEKKLEVIDTLLDKVIELEMISNNEDKALLFRGTNGIPAVSGMVALDYPFFGLDNNKSMDRSLSYGISLYAGLFRESHPLEKKLEMPACAMNYFAGSKYGYAIKIPRHTTKNPLFQIPSLGLLGRLFSEGEYWHPRNKLGLNKVDDLSTIASGYFGAPTLQKLQALNFGVNETNTPEELSLKIAEYIAENAVVLKGPSEEALKAQREIIELVKHPPQDISALLETLESPHEQSRQNALIAIGLIQPLSRENIIKIIDKIASKKESFVFSKALNKIYPLSQDLLIEIANSKMLNNQKLNYFHQLPSKYIIDSIKSSNKELSILSLKTLKKNTDNHLIYSDDLLMVLPLLKYEDSSIRQAGTSIIIEALIKKKVDNLSLIFLKNNELKEAEEKNEKIDIIVEKLKSLISPIEENLYQSIQDILK